ncbi:C39 family peptidase [Novipirellula galeiformis]|uniref:C39 family peptidase n=1 Tax=Novipirellula galeiformis TaxID=2528004 RepID=UPI0018CD73BB|nr:cysteine peptidase family C39 domain-containing protein [Novipirellula galeiformis]
MISKIAVTIALASLCLSASMAEAQQVSIAGRSVVRDPKFIFQKPVDSWKERKTRHVVMQQRDYSCGAAALATLVRYYWGHNVTEEMVLNVVEKMLTQEELQDRAKEGLTVADVEAAAVKMGYKTMVGKVTLAKLSESKVPVIIVINLGGTNHFVVVRDIIGGCVFLADPLRGNIRISTAGLQQSWVENAILVVAPEGETQSSRSQMAVTDNERIEGYLNRQVIRREVAGGVSAIQR